jgi:hypothetical protein
MTIGLFYIVNKRTYKTLNDHSAVTILSWAFLQTTGGEEEQNIVLCEVVTLNVLF